MDTGIPTPIEGAGATPGLSTLLTWFSPAFPIGAFAHSNGLEAAVAQGDVTDAPAVRAWIAHLLEAGGGWNDLVLLCEAFRRASADDAAGVREVSDLALALSGSAERRAETEALGAAFAAMSGAWGPAGEAFAYPVAVGWRGTVTGARQADLAVAFAHGFAANLVSAAVRLVPLGQADAVAVLRQLEPCIEAVAARAMRATLDDLGSFALLSDIAAMRHETLRTRLFRT